MYFAFTLVFTTIFAFRYGLYWPSGRAALPWKVQSRFVARHFPYFFQTKVIIRCIRWFQFKKGWDLGNERGKDKQTVKTAPNSKTTTKAREGKTNRQ